MLLEDLKKKDINDLLKDLSELDRAIDEESLLGFRRHEVLFRIVEKVINKKEEVAGQGVLEVLSDGYGFLRSEENNYLPSPEDIYVSPNMIRRWRLKTGDTLEGTIRAPKDNEKFCVI